MWVVTGVQTCFFPSRRRHTSLRRDLSSDVCSSDLIGRCVDRTSGAFGGDFDTLARGSSEMVENGRN